MLHIPKLHAKCLSLESRRIIKVLQDDVLLAVGETAHWLVFLKTITEDRGWRLLHHFSRTIAPSHYLMSSTSVSKKR